MQNGTWCWTTRIDNRLANKALADLRGDKSPRARPTRGTCGSLLFQNSVRLDSHIQSHGVTVRGGRGAILELGQVTDLCIFFDGKSTEFTLNPKAFLR